MKTGTLYCSPWQQLADFMRMPIQACNVCVNPISIRTMFDFNKRAATLLVGPPNHENHV